MMEYNTSRERLKYSEYGRNIQKMIEYIQSIEDKEKKNKMAAAVIHSMSVIQPGGRDYADYKRKLWDHLHLISDNQLDIDSPFPLPAKAEHLKPEPVGYQINRSMRYRYYGRNLENMILQAIQMEEGAERDMLVGQIANTMKKLYTIWNKESVTDDIIRRHLGELSGGKLGIDEGKSLENTNEFLRAVSKPQQRGGRQEWNNKNNNNKRNKNFKRKY
jgi:hypothetical protein